MNTLSGYLIYVGNLSGRRCSGVDMGAELGEVGVGSFDIGGIQRGGR